MNKFDETKHHRDHGRFSHGLAVGAAAGAAGGALLGGALLTRRLSGLRLARRGVDAAAHVVGDVVHDAGDAIHHAVEGVAQITHVEAPRAYSVMRWGAHTPHGGPIRAYHPGVSARDQGLSRAYRGLHTHFEGKKLTGKHWQEAERAYHQRRELAAKIRAYRHAKRTGAPVEKLAKFLDTQHPRDGHGRFAEGAGVQRRTQHKMPGYYRNVGRVRHGAAAPEDTELPVGSFLRASLPFHKPKALSADERKAIEQGVISVISKQREATIARGLGDEKQAALIPEGTSKRTINRAYNHAAMIAVHKYGLGHYDFAMDDELKAEMTPLVPFIRYAQRRVLNTMLAEHKGEWKPYREEFGIPFKDKQKDADGKVRLRVKPLQQLIKAAEFGTLCKAVFDEHKHKRDDHGRWTDDHPNLTAAGAIAGGSVAAGVAVDTRNLVRGSPGKMKPPRGFKIGLARKLREKSGLPPMSDENLMAEHWRQGTMAGLANGSIGEGSAKARFASGFKGGADTFNARIDHLVNSGAGYRGATRQKAKQSRLDALFGTKPKNEYEDLPAVTRPKQVWRGVHGGGGAQWLNAKPGDVVTQHAPSSYSRDSSVGSHFANYSFHGAEKGSASGNVNEGPADALIRAFGGKPDTGKPATARSQRAGAQLSAVSGGSNLHPDTKRARIVLRGADKLPHTADIDHAASIAGPQQEILVGRGAKIRVDKVRDSKAGRVIFATAIEQNAKSSFRRGVMRRMMDPAYQGGRVARSVMTGLFYGAPLAWATHGRLWGQKPDDAKKS